MRPEEHEHYGTNLPIKMKFNKLHGQTYVDNAGTWKESESSYRGRSHGREEIIWNHFCFHTTETEEKQESEYTQNL